MTDTASAAAAAFFASKKKTGRKKKFNANKISIGAMPSSGPAGTEAAGAAGEHGLGNEIHVDAPKLSRAAVLDDLLGGPDDGWTDPGKASHPPSSSSAASKKKPKEVGELLDMSALVARRAVEDDIVERLRIEETRGLLQAAADAQKKKEAEETGKRSPAAEPPAAVTPAPAPTRDGKWVPPHLRGRPAVSAAPMGLGSAMRRTGKKVDTGDERSFPTLSQGVAAVAQEEEAAKKQSARGGTRTSTSATPTTTSGLATNTSWAAQARKRREEMEKEKAKERLMMETNKETQREEVRGDAIFFAQAKKHQGKEKEALKQTPETQPPPHTPHLTTAVDTTNTTATAAPPTSTTKPAVPELKKERKKKKKKDLSTFKAK
uniref:Uncharacterized protein n=1 Tax=Corethron hystrix TaxID=216773 RepID=A0A7S1FVF6_9STRA|eukprot:CAMPEP_0113315646 /NCGR_PEP_ID=MMETSP0010_2-20120614/11232_1 /TAXON_ID=216773 ORGANISM="Corethron hystrix, Strain 308" /NCGR_SAMPLE_ID=MMETSP0010_2 /ASSEMBLY_ACC=CAM_ASM_000155 /LENGTH=375 /DNA_ID=CAMNT_0000172191 /DNA_START=116 /DNA_END=1243 /DNA_ORIENTATION=- /assembly_acc=CAM_ASM_000155